MLTQEVCMWRTTRITRSGNTRSIRLQCIHTPPVATTQMCPLPAERMKMVTSYIGRREMGWQVTIFTHLFSFFFIFKMILAPDGGPPSVNSTGISYTDISVIWTEPPRYHHNGILLGE